MFQKMKLEKYAAPFPIGKMNKKKIDNFKFKRQQVKENKKHYKIKFIHHLNIK